jgi:hypothetical protein
MHLVKLHDLNRIVAPDRLQLLAESANPLQNGHIAELQDAPDRAKSQTFQI